jgi:hypothetical protein
MYSYDVWQLLASTDSQMLHCVMLTSARIQLAKKGRSHSIKSQPYSGDDTAAAATATLSRPRVLAAASAVAVTAAAAAPIVSTKREGLSTLLAAAAAPVTTAAAVLPAHCHESVSVYHRDDVACDVVSYVAKRSLDLQLLEKIMHAGSLLEQFKQWQLQLQDQCANTTVTIGSTLYPLAFWRRHYVQQQSTAVEGAVEQLMRVLEHCRALHTHTDDCVADIAIHEQVLQEWCASVVQDSHHARARLQQVCTTVTHCIMHAKLSMMLWKYEWIQNNCFLIPVLATLTF